MVLCIHIGGKFILMHVILLPRIVAFNALTCIFYASPACFYFFMNRLKCCQVSPRFPLFHGGLNLKKSEMKGMLAGDNLK